METAGAGDGERWLLETLVGIRVAVALGSRLRGNDEGAAHPRPSRERRGGGAGTTSYAKVSFRGNGGEAAVYYIINWKRD